MIVRKFQRVNLQIQKCVDSIQSIALLELSLSMLDMKILLSSQDEYWKT